MSSWNKETISFTGFDDIKTDSGVEVSRSRPYDEDRSIWDVASIDKAYQTLWKWMQLRWTSITETDMAADNQHSNDPGILGIVRTNQKAHRGRPSLISPPTLLISVCSTMAARNLPPDISAVRSPIVSAILPGT